jgi:hypothetical protein
MTDSEKMDLILEKLGGLDEKFSGLQNDVTEIKLILENEIRVNIQRVAEGHLDLSRNLHEAMKPSNEVEMLAIKVRMLETDMMEIKRKIS